MTGTWEGTVKCRIFGDPTSGVPDNAKTPGVGVEISDTSGDLNHFVDWDGAQFPMDGVVFNNAKKPDIKSEGGFGDCANNGNI